MRNFLKRLFSRNRKTLGQKAFNDFLDENKTHPENIMPPPMKAEKALEMLRLHFASDYVSVNPINGEQFNTELVWYIMSEYRGRI